MGSILIIEDNVNQCALYAEELTDDGYDVACAANGPEALKIFNLQYPDLVILDILLPCMTGIEVMERMLAKKPDLQFVIHSAYSSPRLDFVAGLAFAYVMKSGNLDVLKHHIRAAMVNRGVKVEIR